MKIIKILGTLIFLLAFSGCYDANEPNDYAYVVAIGVDEAEEEGEFEISIQFAKPAQISGGGSEEGGKGGETLGLVTVEAPTIYSGINIANNIVSKRFQLSHTKIIVISEEIAKKGISDIIYTIVRSSDLRPNMYIAVAKGGAKEYLAAVKPEMEINPVKYYQLVFENEYAEFVPKTVSQHIYFYMGSNEKDIILPIVSKSSEPKEEKSQSGSESQEGQKNGGGESGGDEGDNKEENTELPKTDAKTNYDSFEYLMKEYIAGNVVANKKNKSETMGMGVFNDDKMVGEMNGIESELYNIVNGTFQYSYDTFYSDKTPDKPMVVMVQQYKKPSVKVETSSDSPKIKLKVSLEGNLVASPDDYLVESDIYNFEVSLENYVQEAVKKFLYKTSREFGTDIVGFGSYAKRNFFEYSDFENYDWKEAYKKAEFDVDVKFRMRRVGLIIKDQKEDKGDTK